MAGNGVPSILGFVGGLLIILAGAVSFVLAIVRNGAPSGLADVIVPAAVAGFALVLGLLILFFSRPRFFWWRGRLLFNGVVLVLLGIVTFVVLDLGLLVVAGALLAVVSGAIFVVESFLPRRSFLRRSWF